MPNFFSTLGDALLARLKQKYDVNNPQGGVLSHIQSGQGGVIGNIRNGTPGGVIGGMTGGNGGVVNNVRNIVAPQQSQTPAQQPGTSIAAEPVTPQVGFGATSATDGANMGSQPAADPAPPAIDSSMAGAPGADQPRDPNLDDEEGLGGSSGFGGTDDSAPANADAGGDASGGGGAAGALQQKLASNSHSGLPEGQPKSRLADLNAAAEGAGIAPSSQDDVQAQKLGYKSYADMVAAASQRGSQFQSTVPQQFRS